MNYNILTLAAFIDLEGAFNKVTFEAINKALRKFGVDSTLIRWIMAMLNNRILSVDLFGAHRKGIADRGCPQGGVLPPLLWNMTVDDLLTKLNAKGYLAIGYADDIAILISGKFEETLGQLMDEAFRIVEKWCLETGLSVNPTKTGLVLFTRKRKLLALRLPTLFGVELELADKAKYLGVILDSKLSWREQIEERNRKASKVFWQCRKAFGKNWGLRPSVLHWMYKAIVRPILCYGCMVWSHKTEQVNVSDDLTHVQRLACLAITGAMSSTPTAALEIMLSLTPMSLYVKQEAELIVTRLFTAGHWLAGNRKVGHAKILCDLKKRHKELSMPQDRLLAVYEFERKFDSRIPSRDEWKDGVSPVEGDFTLYTDGSKTDDGTGSGVYCEELKFEISIPLGALATVFQSEVYAICEGTSVLLERNLLNKKVVICTDSEASIEALSSCKISSRTVLQCRHVLDLLSENNDVCLTWVPGHTGIVGNEKADELARNGSRSNSMDLEPILGNPASLMVNLIKEKTKEKHQMMWNDLSTCRQAKEFLLGCKKQTTKFLLSLSRQKLRKIVSILSGHNTLRYHLNKIGRSNSPNCRGCDLQPETAKHFLCFCPSLGNLRAKCLGDYYLTPEEIQKVPLSNMLSFALCSGWLDWS